MSNELVHKFITTELSDYTSILNLSSKIVKSWNATSAAKKIAVIGTSSLQMIVMTLKAMLICEGYDIDFYEGEYSGLKMDIFDPSSRLYEFNPEIIIMIPDIHDIVVWPELLCEKDEVIRCADEEVAAFNQMFETIHSTLPNTHIFCTNLTGPPEEAMGNLGGASIFSKHNYLSVINLDLAYKNPDYVTIVDVNRLACEIGFNHWFDPSAYVMSKQGFSLSWIGYFCYLLKLQIMALTGKTRKCLVLDLDNTLWGGTVGDLGYENIILDPNDPEGEAYLTFQKYILELKSRGVLVAVCSKNDEEVAKKPFELNQYMKLKLDDISCFVANWQDKVSNIRQIAESLNIGIDSMVFFDDNPTERALVEKFLPEVLVIDVPEDVAEYTRTLDRVHAFDWLQITKEDLNRTSTYVSNKKREELRLSYSDYSEYLKQLKMRAKFELVKDSSINRFVQLLNKSNQFNLVTNRYSEAAINELRNNEKYCLYTVSLSDCYSDYGIISCVVTEFDGNICKIRDWCMSCRVLNKGVETFILKKMIDLCVDRGITRIDGEYKRTDKNKLVEKLYNKLGFEEDGFSSDFYKLYHLRKERYFEVNTENYIKEV